MAKNTNIKVGVLVPFTNTNLEPDMARLLPQNYQAHFTRIGGYDLDEIPGPDQMTAMGATNISEPLRLISGIRPDFVLYGCTSATLMHGPTFDQTLTARIAKETGAKAISAAGAILSRLRALKVGKIGFASPYVGEVNEHAFRFFAAAGIKTVGSSETSKDLSSHEQGALSPDDVFELALQADHPEAEVIVMACTDLRAVEAMPRIETAVNKPVICSNHAMVSALLM